jgi:protein gp37
MVTGPFVLHGCSTCATGVSVRGVPFFFKQWGGRTSKAGGRTLDDREWSEMPTPRLSVTV